MENWYVPITIVPGIGLLLMSTSHLMVALSAEIKAMIAEGDHGEKLMQRKLSQLKRINLASVFLYLSVAFFVVAGLVSGLDETLGTHYFWVSLYITIAGIISALAGLLLLITYSFKAVRIRQDQYHKTC